MRLAADEPRAFPGIEIGIFKQAAVEAVDQEANGALLKPRAHRPFAMARAADFIRLEHRPDVVVAAELIDAVFDGEQVAFRHRKLLHAVAPAAEGIHLGIRVVGDDPIRADDAVVSSLAAQHPADDMAAEAVAHLPARRVHPPGNGIIGHDGGRLFRLSAKVKCALQERLQMRLRAAAGMHGEFAERIMRVAARLAGTAAGPVLGHRRDGARAPAAAAFIGLQAVAVRPAHIGDQIRMRAEGIANAHPPRLGTHVHLRAERRRQAHRAVFPADHPRVLLAQRRIKRSRNAKPLGPFAGLPAAGFILRARCRRAVTRIGADVDRNTIGQRLGKGLQLVAPAGRGMRILQPGSQHMADMIVFQELLLLIRQIRRRSAAFLKRLAAIGADERSPAPSGHHLMAAVEHQACHFLDAQAGRQIARPLLRRKPPIFIG